MVEDKYGVQGCRYGGTCHNTESAIDPIPQRITASIAAFATPCGRAIVVAADEQMMPAVLPFAAPNCCPKHVIN
jgi:hypothetical protein